MALLLYRYLGANDQLTIVDGDKVEQGNLGRQCFMLENVGQFKSECLMNWPNWNCTVWSLMEYFKPSMELEHWTVILSCVDNHATRRIILEYADATKSPVITMGNENESFEAYLYCPRDKGSVFDPRIMYPVIATSTAGRPDEPCTHVEEGEERPQRLAANMNAAHAGFWLLDYLNTKEPELEAKVKEEYAPVIIRGTATKIEFFNRKEWLKGR
jgi:hypothetical protein